MVFLNQHKKHHSKNPLFIERISPLSFFFSLGKGACRSFLTVVFLNQHKIMLLAILFIV